MLESKLSTYELLSLVKVINNCALLKSFVKITDSNFRNENYIPNKKDKLIVSRLKVLIKAKFNGVCSIHSKEIYSGVCSKQNWYYRVLTNRQRLFWILESTFNEFEIQMDINQPPSVLKKKSLYTKTKRLNYSEGLRRLRCFNLLLFLNFTTMNKK